MKKIILPVLSILFMYSCDVVESPYTKNDNTTIIDTSSNNSFVKKIIVEEFTGHLCPGCPEAARELDLISEVYGDQVIPIAMHVTKSFARPYTSSQAPKFQYDFRTFWGDYIDNFYEVSLDGLPRGMVNRIGYPNNHKIGWQEWASTIENELAKEINFGISIETSENNISVNTTVTESIDGNFNIAVCLIEDNIVNWQKDSTAEVSDYIHKHVLRSYLMEESLSNSSNYLSNQEISKSISYNLENLEQYNIEYSENTVELGNGNAGGWNEDYLYIVAYIYNTSTNEIVQAEKQKLK